MVLVPLKIVNLNLKIKPMSYFGMGFGQSETHGPQRRVSRLNKIKDYIDDKKIKYKSNIIMDEALLNERKKIIINNYIKRNRERSSAITIIFLIILLLFILGIIKIIISVKNTYFAINKIQVADKELFIDTA